MTTVEPEVAPRPLADAITGRERGDDLVARQRLRGREGLGDERRRRRRRALGGDVDEPPLALCEAPPDDRSELADVADVGPAHQRGDELGGEERLASGDGAAPPELGVRPRDLTRAQLAELQAKLIVAGYSPTSLKRAWKDWKNQDIAATIIGFIRQRALGSPLVPYADRVDRAVAKVLATGDWTTPQKKWLGRIAEQLKVETVVDQDAFRQGAFATAGGWKGIDELLGGRLTQVMADLGDEIWNDERAA